MIISPFQIAIVVAGEAHSSLPESLARRDNVILRPDDYLQCIDSGELDEVYLVIVVADDLEDYTKQEFKMLREFCKENDKHCIAVTRAAQILMPQNISCVFTLSDQFETLAPIFVDQMVRMLEDKELICIEISDFIAVTHGVDVAQVTYREAPSFEELREKVKGDPLVQGQSLLLSRVIAEEGATVNEACEIGALLERQSGESESGLFSTGKGEQLKSAYAHLVITTQRK